MPRLIQLSLGGLLNLNVAEHDTRAGRPVKATTADYIRLSSLPHIQITDRQCALTNDKYLPGLRQAE